MLPPNDKLDIELRNKGNNDVARLLRIIDDLQREDIERDDELGAALLRAEEAENKAIEATQLLSGVNTADDATEAIIKDAIKVLGA